MISRHGRVTCPRCHTVHASIGSSCPSCAYTGHDCVARFPYAAPPFAPLMDFAGILGETDGTAIQSGIGRVRRRFPQLGLWFCTLKLPDTTDPREFAFWMMNASPVESSEDAVQRLHGLLLFYEPGGRRLCLTLGYATEAVLRARDLHDDLAPLHAAFTRAHYRAGFEKWIASLLARLDDAWAWDREHRDNAPAPVSF